MEKDNQIFGIRAIIEAINAKKEIDKVFVQKMHRRLDARFDENDEKKQYQLLLRSC